MNTLLGQFHKLARVMSISILVIMITLSQSLSLFASSTIPLFKVDGKLFVTPKGEPEPYFNKDNRTMGSLRLVGNALGVSNADIIWDNAKQKATMKKGTRSVTVTVGNKVMYANGSPVTMDTVAELKYGRVFIPVKYIAQGLGVSVGFDNATQTVLLYTKPLNQIANNNFADVGLKQVADLPLELKTSDGLKLTVHEAYVYPTSSAEAKALDAKYDLWKFEDGYFLVWLNVTLENTSNRVISQDYRDLLEKVYVMGAEGSSMVYTTSLDMKYDTNNNTEMLYFWSLKPGEKVTSNIQFVETKNKNLEFIGVGLRTANGAGDYKDLAEK